MLFLTHIILTILLFAIIILSCALFTNAIEHLGCKLKLGSNAVGSILAVIGTTLPETLVPLIAIIGSRFFLNNSKIGEDIALGGIIGSPFMLCCLALFLIGIEIVILYLIKKRKSLDLNVNYKSVLRDFKYFLLAYTPAVSIMFCQNKIIKVTVVLYLLSLYCIYVYRTIVKSRQNFCEECLDELIFSKFLKNNGFFAIIVQILVSLALLVVSIQCFVCEIEYFSALLKISPIILSLIITPFATELPECINSLIWVKNNKDDLAIFNVEGAIVFQAIIPMSIGIILTPFTPTKAIILNVILVIITSIVFILKTIINKKVNYISLLMCGIAYFLFIGYLFFK